MISIDKAHHSNEIKNYTSRNRMGLALIITSVAIIALEMLSSFLIYKSFISLPHQLRSIIFTFKGFSTSISLTAFEGILIGASSTAVASGVMGALLILKKQQVRKIIPSSFEVKLEQERNDKKPAQILTAEKQFVELMPQQTYIQKDQATRNEIDSDLTVQSDQAGASSQSKPEDIVDADQEVVSTFLKELTSAKLKKADLVLTAQNNTQSELEKNLGLAFDAISNKIRVEHDESPKTSDVSEDEWKDESVKIDTAKSITTLPVITQPPKEVTLKEAVEQAIEREKYLKNGVAFFEIHEEGTPNENLVLFFKLSKSCGPARTMLSHLLKVSINQIHFAEDQEKGDRITLNLTQLTKFKNSL